MVMGSANDIQRDIVAYFLISSAYARNDFWLRQRQTCVHQFTRNKRTALIEMCLTKRPLYWLISYYGMNK